LVEEVRHELQQLKQVADIAGRLAALPEAERRPWDSAAAAKFVADLVIGLENLCKRRYAYLKRAVPEGADSHSRILYEFLEESELGDALSEEVRERLKRYLRFRHRFFHGYGHEVDWQIVEEPLRSLPDTVAKLAEAWEFWLTQMA